MVCKHSNFKKLFIKHPKPIQKSLLFLIRKQVEKGNWRIINWENTCTVITLIKHRPCARNCSRHFGPGAQTPSKVSNSWRQTYILGDRWLWPAKGLHIKYDTPSDAAGGCHLGTRWGLIIQHGKDFLVTGTLRTEYAFKEFQNALCRERLFGTPVQPPGECTIGWYFRHYDLTTHHIQNLWNTELSLYYSLYDRETGEVQNDQYKYPR